MDFNTLQGVFCSNTLQEKPVSGNNIHPISGWPYNRSGFFTILIT